MQTLFAVTVPFRPPGILNPRYQCRRLPVSAEFNASGYSMPVRAACTSQCGCLPPPAECSAFLLVRAGQNYAGAGRMPCLPMWVPAPAECNAPLLVRAGFHAGAGCLPALAECNASTAGFHDGAGCLPAPAERNASLLVRAGFHAGAG